MSVPRSTQAEAAPPSAQVRARDAAGELVRLAALLSAENKRQILERIQAAFASAGERLGPPPPPAPRPAGTRAPAAATGTAVCPHCRVGVTAAKLAKHIRKVHPEAAVSRAAAPPPRKQAPPTPAAPGRPPRHLEPVVCGDCRRTMTRQDYQVHVCRQRGPYLLQGGGPGLGRRR